MPTKHKYIFEIKNKHHPTHILTILYTILLISSQHTILLTSSQYTMLLTSSQHTILLTSSQHTILLTSSQHTILLTSSQQHHPHILTTHHPSIITKSSSLYSYPHIQQKQQNHCLIIHTNHKTTNPFL